MVLHKAWYDPRGTAAATRKINQDVVFSGFESWKTTIWIHIANQEYMIYAVYIPPVALESYIHVQSHFGFQGYRGEF